MTNKFHKRTKGKKGNIEIERCLHTLHDQCVPSPHVRRLRAPGKSTAAQVAVVPAVDCSRYEHVSSQIRDAAVGATSFLARAAGMSWPAQRRPKEKGKTVVNRESGSHIYPNHTLTLIFYACVSHTYYNTL